MLRLLLAPLLLTLAGCAGLAPRGGDDLFDLQRRAAQAYQEQHYEAALPLYLELTERVPRDALAWFRLGNVQARLAQPDAAVQSYRHALLLNPKLGKAWYNMGLVQLREAAATYTEMAAHIEPVDPLQPRALHNAEVLLELLGAAPGQDHAGATER
ncbi:MAG TPA: tetratricopeptide repeat protein [Gammaproteobacteria bacterium]|nr:tetratricopeptide repeat protein [Gammaproteobacteria bacterium]